MERPYNESSASISCGGVVAVFDFCAPCWRRRRSHFHVRVTRRLRRNRHTASPPTPAAHVSATGQAPATPPRATTATTGGDRSTSNRGRVSNLPGGSVPRVVRCGARPAVLHLRRHGSVCRRGDVLPHAARRTRLARLQGATDPHVRGRTLPRRDDGVSARRHGKRLDLGRVAGYLNPQPKGQPARFPTIVMIVPPLPPEQVRSARSLFFTPLPSTLHPRESP